MNAPRQKHIEVPVEKDRGARVQDGARIRSLMEHNGWPVLAEYVQAWLAAEQKRMMTGNSVAPGDAAAYDRKVGQWNGVELYKAIAEGIVAQANKADVELRADDARREAAA